MAGVGDVQAEPGRAALLLSGLSGEHLLGLREATKQELVERGRLASAQLLRLMESGLL